MVVHVCRSDSNGSSMAGVIDEGNQLVVVYYPVSGENEQMTRI